MWRERSFLVLAPFFVFACGPASHPPDSPTRESSSTVAPLSIDRRETIAPGKLFEINLSFASNAEANANFKTSGGSVKWNVHSHPDGGVVVHDHGEGTQDTVSFRATSAGVYSFAWENAGAQPITLSVQVTGDPTVTEWKR